MVVTSSIYEEDFGEIWTEWWCVDASPINISHFCLDSPACCTSRNTEIIHKGKDQDHFAIATTLCTFQIIQSKFRLHFSVAGDDGLPAEYHA